MTALREYERLEATGLWRPSPEDQRREVIVSIGDATLVITDMQDRPLTHWSLAAVRRENPGRFPATYSPDGDPGETLELAESETGMIEALERLRRAVERARPHPGRLRNMGAILSVAAVVALAILWLPGALARHTVSVLPEAKRAEIGRALLAKLERATGQPCDSATAMPALARLAGRTGVARVVILPDGPERTYGLPGGMVVLHRAMVEAHEDPAVTAGYVLAEKALDDLRDPLAEFLRHAGPAASFRLLTSGEVTDASVAGYAEHLLLAAPMSVPPEALADAFRAATVPASPYARAQGDPTLAAADPMAGQDTPPVLRDRDWLLLQEICGG